MPPVLFLTACVNPEGMAYTKVNNPEVRLTQYREAVDWYLANTDFKILLVENSGHDFSDKYERPIADGRMEFLCFDGNSYDRSLGKGYGEARIIEYGATHSAMLRNTPGGQDLVIKVTGRLICKNINALYAKHHSPNTVYAGISKDDWGGDIASSQVVSAPAEFWTECFLPHKEEINDSQCRHFEHILYEAITQWKAAGNKHREFWTPPQLIGVSGTSGAAIGGEPPSAKQLCLYRIMCLLHRFGYRGYLNPFYHGEPKKPIEV